MGICYIVGSMENRGPLCVGPDDLLLAADGGYRWVRERGLSPDVVAGDFDSLGYVPEAEEIRCSPVHKDETDMLLCVRIGLEKGYRKFCLLGGMGGRLDHTLANLQTLAYITRHGAKGVLVGEDFHAAILENGALTFRQGARGIVSVFAYGGTAAGVYLKGLAYPLTAATLTEDFPLGVSNAFTGVEASVAVGNGKLLVLWQGSLEDTDLFTQSRSMD